MFENTLEPIHPLQNEKKSADNSTKAQKKVCF